MLLLVKTMSSPLWLEAPGRFLLVTASWELVQPDGPADDNFAGGDATVEGLADVAAELSAVGAVVDGGAAAGAVVGGELCAVDLTPSEDDEQLLNAMTAKMIATALPSLRPAVPSMLSNVISASICADRLTATEQ